jgi:hypothetical protein
VRRGVGSSHMSGVDVVVRYRNSLASYNVVGIVHAHLQPMHLVGYL